MKFMNDPPRYSCLENAPSTYAPFMCFQKCLLKPMEATCKCHYIGMIHDELDPAADGNATSTNETATVCRPGQLLTCGYKVLNRLKKEPNFETSCKAKCKARCK